MRDLLYDPDVPATIAELLGEPLLPPENLAGQEVARQRHYALVVTRARLVDALARVAELEAAICEHREAIPGNRRRQADRTLHGLVEDS